MGSVDNETEFEYLQDVLGQMLMLRTYTQICLCFPVSDESTFPEILECLRLGLGRLAAHFPWLAGRMVVRGKTDTQSGSAHVVRSEKDISLIIKDLREDQEMPSMSALREAKFPFKLLDRNKIAEAPAIGEAYDDTKDEPVRVLILQANLIKGGVLLNFAGVHNTMDMNGLGQVIYLFSKACRDEPFTAQEIELGNCSRHEQIPLLDEDFQPGPEFHHFIAKIPESTAEPKEEPEQMPPLSWNYFNFDAHNLSRLKGKAASQTLVNYISTNDALTALIWQSIVKARTTRASNVSVGPSLMMRGVDGRRLFGLSKEYIGHMVAGTYTVKDDVHDLPLDSLSGQLRMEIESSQLKYMTQGLATLLNRASDKTTVGYVPNVDVTRDVMISSWAKVPCYHCDFGILGKPESVRRARLAPFPGLVYFMPKSREGDIAAAICLPDEDTAYILKDDHFMSYAEYIG